jgi:hypothetical protein
VSGIAPARLSDDALARELERLHATRRETFLNGSQGALETHTDRMLALEAEYIRRFPERVAPDPARVRAARRTPHF